MNKPCPDCGAIKGWEQHRKGCSNEMKPQTQPKASASETAAERDRLTVEIHDKVRRLESVTNQAFALRKQRDELLAACKAIYDDPYSHCSCAEKVRVAIQKAEKL